MSSTRKPNAKARKSRELDMLFDYGDMDVMLGDGNSNSIERDLDNLNIVPEGNRIFSLSRTEEIHLRRMKLETSAIEMSLLGKKD